MGVFSKGNNFSYSNASFLRRTQFSGVFSSRKEFAPPGANSFLYEKIPFHRAISSSEASKNSCKLNYFEKRARGFIKASLSELPGRIVPSVGHLTRKSGVLGSIPCLATYFHFSFCFFKKGSCQLLSYWRKYVQEVLVNRLGGLGLPRKSVVSRHDLRCLPWT